MGLYKVAIGFDLSFGLHVRVWPKCSVLISLPFLCVEIRLEKEAKGFHVYWPWEE